ncbi:response regulator receiver domain protein (macronuclear) [Tetrahymena thermophila SB210]|uniref:Response regulator receiver domain protein n=1 Tax=Tetrahymena thermophila (strain SB210) TaxID=312017 RepID=I7LVX3_TETTS|nr:response regulator receiver domain protein [Tetrahymena thermophila SB210]EAS00277.2 response regulator receiver domain protein [Tetrahymena thermophila SB210]|eukprot:XP_001020522.2 response regulator receiver domain protein [Tetrahymena thermophila SB210]
MFRSKLFLSFKDQFVGGQYNKQKEAFLEEQLKIISSFKIIFSIGIVSYCIFELDEQYNLIFKILPYFFVWLAILVATIKVKQNYKIYVLKRIMVILIEIAYTIVYREVLMRRFSIDNSQILSKVQLYFLLFFQLNQLITICIFDSWIMKIFHLIFHTEYIVFRLIEPNFWIMILQIGLGFATLLYYNSEFLNKKNFWKQTIKYENSRGWQYLIDQFLPLQIFVVSYSKQIKKSSQDKQQPEKENALKQQNPSTIKQFNSTNFNSNKDTKLRNTIQQSHALSDKCKSDAILNYAKDSQQQESSSYKLIRKEDLEVMFCNKNILQIFNLTQKNDLIDIAENMFFPSAVQHQSQSYNFQKLDSPESKQTTDPHFMNTVTKIKCNEVSSSEMSCDESESTTSQKFVPKNLLEKLQYDLYPLYQQEQCQINNVNEQQEDDEEDDDDDEQNQNYDFESFNQFRQFGNIQFNQIFQDFEFLKCSNSNYNNGDIYCNIKYCHKNKKNKTFDLKIIKCMWKKKSSFIVMMTDISKKEQMLRMREIDKFKDKVIDSITHNLKTPLNGILLSCQTLQMNLKQSENLEILEHIYQNSFILLNMINDILDYSRFLKDQLKLEMKEYNMSSILDEIYAIMKLQFDIKKLQFNIKDYTMDAQIFTDKNRLIQVLLQFLTNSIKFTQKGYVKLKVSKYKNAFKFTIEDTGQGMSKQQIERLGNLFMQPHKSYQHGVGLGFIMCKHLLDKMSSENNLTVVSEENKGTTVIFFIRSDHPQNKIQNRQITENNNNELQNQKQNLVTADHSEEQNNPKMQKKNSLYIMASDHLKQAIEHEIQDNKENAIHPQLNKKYIPHLNTQNPPQKQLDDQYSSQEYSIGHNQQSFLNFKQEKIFYTPESIHNAKLPPHFGSPSLFSLAGQRDSIVMDQSHYLYGNNQQQFYGKSSFHDNHRISEIKQDIDTLSKQYHSQQDLQQSRRSSQNKRIVSIFQDKNRENQVHNHKSLTYPQDVAALQKHAKTLNHLTENTNQNTVQQNKFNSRTHSLYQEEYLPQLNMQESIFVCPNSSQNNLNQKSFNCINLSSTNNKNKIQFNNNNNNVNNLQYQNQFVNIQKPNQKPLLNTNFQKPQQPSINLISQIYVSSHSDSSIENNEDDKDFELREKQMSENKQQIKVYCQEKKVKDDFSCFHFSNSLTRSQSQNVQREEDQIQEDQEKLIIRHLNFQNLRSTPQKYQSNEQVNECHSNNKILQQLTTPTLKYIDASPFNDKCEQNDNLLNNHLNNQITQSPATNITNISHQHGNKANDEKISVSIPCLNNCQETISKPHQIQKQKIVSQLNLKIPSDQAIQPYVNTTYQDLVTNIQNLIENKIQKILIVDDNPFNILCLQTLLKKFNFLKTYEAHDGKEAVEKVQKEHFDLILMDVNMPVMDGLEATARIKEMLRNNIIEPTKIFIVTAFGDSLDKQKALKIGADAHICKPMTLATLYNELKHNF